MSEVLKPCPFCGEAPTFEEADYPATEGPWPGNQAYCYTCEYSGPSAGRTGWCHTDADVIAAWNRRASPPVVCGNCGGTGTGGADINGKTDPCPYCRPRGGQ